MEYHKCHKCKQYFKCDENYCRTSPIDLECKCDPCMGRGGPRCATEYVSELEAIVGSL